MKFLHIQKGRNFGKMMISPFFFVFFFFFYFSAKIIVIKNVNLKIIIIIYIILNSAISFFKKNTYQTAWILVKMGNEMWNETWRGQRTFFDNGEYSGKTNNDLSCCIKNLKQIQNNEFEYTLKVKVFVICYFILFASLAQGKIINFKGEIIVISKL